MDEKEKVIQDLHRKISELQDKHKEFQQQLVSLQNDVFQFEITDWNAKTSAPPAVSPAPQKPEQKELIPELQAIIKPQPQQQPAQKTVVTPLQQPAAKPGRPTTAKTPLEEFIGTNLLNKAGIATLVLGISIGVKYSIDHELINPLTRLVLAYGAGLILIVIALWLKKKHDNFSAVLLSGGMTVLYFTTYAGYAFFAEPLIPKMPAFGLMVMFTAFTVFAALQYDKQVIGIIGLVGAYAVPFLLSDGSGNVAILFTYITIINVGILMLSFKKYWKSLYYLAFVLTWLTFVSWYNMRYNEELHFSISLGFSIIFFVTFYTTFLSYKLIRKEPFSHWDLVFMLLNSFVSFYYNYATIESSSFEPILGAYTVFTAILHFVGCVILYKSRAEHKDTFYFSAGLVLVFLTLAVPIQLEGNWVTLIWATEAVLVFWIGRVKKYGTYENLSFPLLALALGSLWHDWAQTYKNPYFYNYDTVVKLKLFLNIQFLTTLMVTGAFAIILWINKTYETSSAFVKNNLVHLLNYMLPVAVLFLLYFGIFQEVDAYWNIRYQASKIIIPSSEYGDVFEQYDQDLRRFKTLWLILYSAFFAIAVSILQLRLKNQYLKYLSLGINIIVLFTFITAGLYELGNLRTSYITQDLAQYYIRASGHIMIRYALLLAMIPLLIFNFIYTRQEDLAESRPMERLYFHLVALTVLSNELMHWLELQGQHDSFKLALSILWGSYALMLIILGLWKNLGYLRIAAIVLFSVTLLKLFFYDMRDASTISKTIVLTILGILLLVSSFLYNKFKKTAAS